MSAFDSAAPNPGGPCDLLHLVSTFEVKTDTKWIVQIAHYLDRRRFRMSVACFHGDGPIRDRLEDLGVRTHNLEVPDERDPRGVLRARRLIDNGGYDIVHTHLLRADLLGGLAARWARVPVIVSSVYAIGTYSRARRRLADPMLDVACARLPKHVLAVSDAVRRDCMDRLHIPDDRISVIRTGIDPPECLDPLWGVAKRRGWGIDGHAPLVVTAARLSHEKGIEVLIDAAALVRRERPDARFVVIGEGPMRGELEARIAAADLGEVVRLVGFESDVWHALMAADVFCLPSHSEGMPNAILEAMAAARPIVATAVGGVPEAVVPGLNGVLVRAGDTAGLAKALMEMVNDRTTALRLGQAAKRTVQERFLARTVVARYGQMYQKLLEERRWGLERAARTN